MFYPCQPYLGRAESGGCFIRSKGLAVCELFDIEFARYLEQLSKPIPTHNVARRKRGHMSVGDSWRKLTFSDLGALVLWATV
jgi:hypothetical protein